MESSEYDVAIIGGGILGLSTAMQLSRRLPAKRVAVLEKETQLATHQTGHNSGVIHSGIYYRPGSWKSRFCVDGVQKLVQFCEENEIEYERCGKAIVATDPSELGRLQDLYDRGVANGVAGLEMIGPGAPSGNRTPHLRGKGPLVAPDRHRRLRQGRLRLRQPFPGSRRRRFHQCPRPGRPPIRRFDDRPDHGRRRKGQAHHQLRRPVRRQDR